MLVILFFFFTLNVFGKTPSYYSPGKLTKYKSYRINLHSEYFNTISLFDIDGNELEKVDGSSFTRWDNKINLTYGFGRRLEFSLGGNYRQLNSTASEDEDEISNSGLESFWGGVRYGFRPVQKWQYTIGVRYRMTTYNNDTFEGVSNDTIDLGDAGSEIKFGIYLDYYRNTGHTLSGYAAYNMPPNDLSAEINYKLESAWPSKNWTVLLGMEGVFSLGEDDADLNNTESSFRSGASAQFNSINRSYILPYVGVNFKLGIFLIGLRYAQTMTEVSTDKGQQYLLTFDWNSKNQSSPESRKISRFKEYDVESSIIKISPRKKFLKLDKGLEDDVELGRKFDIYETDYFGSNKLLATGTVIDVGSDWSIIKLVKKYRKSEIKKGFTARGY